MPLLVAVTRTISPVCAPADDTSGVVSPVLLSVSDDPVSDVAATSGAEGDDGAVMSTVTVPDGDVADVSEFASV